MINIPCITCQISDETFLFEKDGYKLVQCNRCGLAYINPQPEPAELDEYYRDYGQLYTVNPRKIRSKFRDARRELRRIKRLTKTAKPRILDVGCSSGYVVKTASEETLKNVCKIAGFKFHKKLLRSPFRDSLKTVYVKNH